MYFIKGIVAIANGIVNFFKYFFIGLFNTIIIIPKYLIILIKKIIGKNDQVITQNKKKSLIMIGLSLCIYFICVFIISKWSVQELKVKYLNEDIINSTEIIEREEQIEDKPDAVENKEQNGTPNNSSVYYPNDYWDYLNVSFIDVNFNDLLSKNSDTVGWIKIDGTKVNYPVVQSKDNDYYLNHSFNKKENVAGWIFADYRVDFKEFGKNTIIYGHNMNNKTMFGSVPNMLYDGYLSNSNGYYIKVSTPTCNTVWKIFSIYTIEPEVYYLKTNFSSEPFGTWLNKIKGRSIHNFGVDVNDSDKVLTLSTCDNTGTKRIAVHAKMINIEYK